MLDYVTEKHHGIHSALRRWGDEQETVKMAVQLAFFTGKNVLHQNGVENILPQMSQRTLP